MHNITTKNITTKKCNNLPQYYYRNANLQNNSTIIAANRKYIAIIVNYYYVFQ